MLIILYAVVLIIYWVMSSRITPEKFPHVDQNHILEWRYRRLHNCQRYAALLVIYILLAVGNGYLAGYAIKHNNMGIAYAGLIVAALYLVGCLIYIVITAWRTMKYAREIGVYKLLHKK